MLSIQSWCSDLLKPLKSVSAKQSNNQTVKQGMSSVAGYPLADSCLEVQLKQASRNTSRATRLLRRAGIYQKVICMFKFKKYICSKDLGKSLSTLLMETVLHWFHRAKLAIIDPSYIPAGELQQWVTSISLWLHSPSPRFNGPLLLKLLTTIHACILSDLHAK